MEVSQNYFHPDSLKFQILGISFWALKLLVVKPYASKGETIYMQCVFDFGNSLIWHKKALKGIVLWGEGLLSDISSDIGF